MQKGRKTIRVFLSSTFSDLKVERNALHERVFPRLVRFCAENGWRFHAIDLRWGVSSEAGLDQRTMSICLGEIERCRIVSPKPNFIVLLGNRYGWRPLPETIEASRFTAIRELLVNDESSSSSLLDGWYKLDRNADPPEYVLQPRGGQWSDAQLYESNVETPLRKAMEQALLKLGVAPEDRLRFEASATEQEIHAGALWIPDASEHVFAFFRDIVDLPVDTHAASYRDLTPNGAVDREAEERQQHLKTRIEQHIGTGNVYRYKVPWGASRTGSSESAKESGPSFSEETLAKFTEAVYERLRRVIEDQIDAHSEMPSLTREIMAHRDFASGQTEKFVGRAAYLEKIRDYVGATDCRRPLVLYGEPGSGKSALLGKLVHGMARDPEIGRCVVRFVGVTPSSTAIRPLLRDLHLEICDLCSVDVPRGELSLDELIEKVPSTLGYAAKKGPVLLVVDALDRLDHAGQAPPLRWLQPELPESIKVIVSTVPGQCLDSLRERLPEAIFLELGFLSTREATTLLHCWLESETPRKRLQEEQESEILGKFQHCPYPLYLRLAYEEGRLWRSYDGVPQYERQQGLASTVEGVLHDMLWRLSRPENHGAILVAKALSYLHCARHGLAEHEILPVLGKDPQYWDHFIAHSWHELPSQAHEEHALPIIVWSRLFHDLSPYLMQYEADGTTLLAFSHQQVGKAVVAAYLADETLLEAIHSRLAAWFGQQADGARRVAELPWQLMKAREWDALSGVLSDAAFLNAVWSAREEDAMLYWAQVERSSRHRVLSAYEPVLRDPSRYGKHLWTIASLLTMLGHPREALNLWKHCTEAAAIHHREWDVIPALMNQAIALKDMGDLDEAMDLLQRQERLCERWGGHNLANCLENQASVLYLRGDYSHALELQEKAIALSEKDSTADDFAASLCNKAFILRNIGREQEALTCLKEAECVFRDTKNTTRLAACLGGQASILEKSRDYQNAEGLYKQQQVLAAAVGDRRALCGAIGNLAQLAGRRGDVPLARELYERKAQICRSIGDMSGLTTCLSNMGVLCLRQEAFAEAQQFIEEAERLSRECGLKTSLAKCLGNKAVLERRLGDLDAAALAHEEEERLCAELQDRRQLATSYGNQALVLKAVDDFEGAWELLMKQEEICVELGDDELLKLCFGNQANLRRDEGDVDRALELLRRHEALCRQRGEVDELAKSLVNQASILGLHPHRKDEALGLAREAVEVLRASADVALMKSAEEFMARLQGMEE